MKFETENNPPKSNPSTEDVSTGILSIDGEATTFAILSMDDMTYLQTAGSVSDGFVLEYQNGSMDEHYRASNETIETEKIIQVFEAFRNGDVSWFDEFEWNKEDLQKGAGCLPVLAMSTLAAGSLIILKHLQG
ncbi:MAG: hypothetical protein ACSHYA_05300 [Opitutaceae bacterium]